MKAYRILLRATALMTFALIVLGAYVRLSDAGLGCPDWPGCYGHATVIQAAEHIEAQLAVNPDGPVSFAKAWKEMVHRYFAGLVGVCILAIAVLSWRLRDRIGQSPTLASALVGVLVLQALFGKWTVTMLLKPAIVTGHLIGGLTTLALLVWLNARTVSWTERPFDTGLRRHAALAFVVLGLQVALGGWVSTNYAALACTDLPLCKGEVVPAMDFHNAFHVVRELGREADGDQLSIEALTAIHWAHRVGALVALVVLGALAVRLRGQRERLGDVLMGVLGLQFVVGLANVLFSLPLPLAAAHNAGAAALVTLLVLINYMLSSAACTAHRGSFQ